MIFALTRLKVWQIVTFAVISTLALLVFVSGVAAWAYAAYQSLVILTMIIHAGLVIAIACLVPKPFAQAVYLKKNQERIDAALERIFGAFQESQRG
jgi:cytochrome c oxidase subunit IV